jgi:hypothetical protein
MNRFIKIGETTPPAACGVLAQLFAFGNLERRSQPPVDIQQYPAFPEVVRTAFSKRP